MAWFPCYKSGGGNSKDSIVTFNPAEKRENINSGEKHKTIFGKIYRWFADLKPVAFTGSYNDLSDKPSNFAPSGHTHSKAQITDFPSSMPASDVYAWAKAASKPAYTAAEVGALSSNGGSVAGNLGAGGNITIGGNIFGICKGYYSGSYHVINFWDNHNLAGFAFLSTSQDYGSLQPHRDAGGSLGQSYRWNDIRAVNSTISTSDRKEKKEISYIGQKSGYEDTNMTDMQLVQLILGLKPVIFKRKNGESDRPHHGIIAQDFEELMKKIGLHDHAAFIKSPKTEEIETIKEDGSKEIKTQEIPGEYMYGIRYEEFISDLIRFCQLLKDENSRQQKKIEDLEKRIKILEDIIKQGA